MNIKPPKYIDTRMVRAYKPALDKVMVTNGLFVRKVETAKLLNNQVLASCHDHDTLSTTVWFDNACPMVVYWRILRPKVSEPDVGQVCYRAEHALLAVSDGQDNEYHFKMKDAVEKLAQESVDIVNNMDKV